MALAPAPYANGNSNYLYHRYNTLGTHYLTSLDCAEDCGNCGNCGGCNDRRCKMKEVSHDDEVEEITLNDYSRRDEEQSNNDYDRKNMRGDVRRNRGGEYPRRDYKTEGVCVKSVNQNITQLARKPLKPCYSFDCNFYTNAIVERFFYKCNH